MGELELAAPAQQWFNVVLIWIGFGTLAGLLARLLMPAREPASAIVVFTLGIIGSVIGPLALSFILRQKLTNPIGPPGLLAATGGALLLMILYRLTLRRPQPEPDVDVEDEDDDE